MARPAADLQGMVFGALRADKRVGSRHGKPLWQCTCACGRQHTAISSQLLTGQVKSCGCRQNPTKNRQCELEGCNKRHFAKGLCQPHYMASEAMATSIESYRDARLRRKYGISAEEYDRMFAAQGGRCACCGKPERDLSARGHKPKTLAVDHNPKTLLVRALLCRRCNTVLGNVEESPDLLRALAAYLERHVALSVDVA